MAKYDRAAAIAYARQWALRRNPLYLNFENLGGDCTNFISQCLYAGIHEMNYAAVNGWFYINGYQRAPAWTGVEFLYRFLTQNNGPGPRASATSSAQALPGDVVQLGHAQGRFYHSLLIITKEPEILVAAHTMDVWMRPLSDYLYDQARFLHIL